MNDAFLVIPLFNDMSNILYIISGMMARNLISSMPSNENHDITNYYIWYLNVQFTLNESDMLDLLMTFMPAPGRQQGICPWS